MGGTMGGIALGALGGRQAAAKINPQGNRGRRHFPKKPNFLILMCDE